METDHLANCDAGQGHKATIDVSHTTRQSPLIMKSTGRDVHEFFPAEIELISAVLAATFTPRGADAFFPVGWLYVAPETAWALPLVFLFGAFNTPLAVGGPALATRLASDDDAPAYLATFNTIKGVVTGVAAIAGGCLASSSVDFAAAPWSDGLRFDFLVSSLGRFASLFFLGPVVDAGSTPISSLLLRKPRWLSVAFAGQASRSLPASAPPETAAAIAQSSVAVE
jgi:hypothetical protein